MKITNVKTLNELGFKKRHVFPKKEQEWIIEAVKNIKFDSFQHYEENFESALKKKLGNGYIRDHKLFEENKSRIKDGESFGHNVDFYHQKMRIAVEVEKTKTTTLLLDVIKFVIGNKKRKNNKSLVEYGVLIFPDKYRTKNKPAGHIDIPLKRLRTELALLSPILFIKDILLIEYDTASFFS